MESSDEEMELDEVIKTKMSTCSFRKVNAYEQENEFILNKSVEKKYTKMTFQEKLKSLYFLGFLMTTVTFALLLICDFSDFYLHTRLSLETTFFMTKQSVMTSACFNSIVQNQISREI